MREFGKKTYLYLKLHAVMLIDELIVVADMQMVYVQFVHKSNIVVKYLHIGFAYENCQYTKR